VPFWHVSVLRAGVRVGTRRAVRDAGVLHTATGSQESAVQGLLSLTETGVPGWQELDWQVSFAVHALPSEHDDPFGLGEQVPTDPVTLQAKHGAVQV